MNETNRHAWSFPDMSFVSIRPALETDLEDIRCCAQRAYAKYTARMDRRPAPMDAEFADQIAKGAVHVAKDESRFAGYVVFYPERDHIHLESVAVLPEYSGRGVGRLLIEHVECTAREAGYKAVELYTNGAMTENLVIYPKMGYVEVNRRFDAGFDRVFFRKQL